MYNNSAASLALEDNDFQKDYLLNSQLDSASQILLHSHWHILVHTTIHSQFTVKEYRVSHHYLVRRVQYVCAGPRHAFGSKCMHIELQPLYCF